MPPAAIDHAHLRQLIEEEGITQAAAAVRLGCSVSCVERTCARLGLRTQRTGPRSGAGHPNWAGGRMRVGRYWYIWTNTHPFRTQGNYVLEHRLVVEASLGRYLLPGEVVHHVNGDPEDNRLENLVLFSSNAEHLKSELTGRTPKWTPEGRARTLAGIRRPRTRRTPSIPDAALPLPSTAHPPSTPERTVPPASESV